MKTNLLREALKYDGHDILDAIEKEGLCENCYGFKTPTCIWIYTEGMKKSEIWDRFQSKIKGYEQALWDSNQLAEVTYFLLIEPVY